MNPEDHILQTWEQNAAPWIRTIAGGAIESRQLVTNDAIVRTITGLQPKLVWDIGCGEGWLCRTLEANGITCIGTDAIAALVESARSQGGGRFEVLSYEAITPAVAQQWQADCFVFNFSLFGHEEVHRLLSILREALSESGHLVIQTLHPFAALGGGPYENGWRPGSWQGFSADFVNPAPWYYRTLAGWVALLMDAGFSIEAVHEPLHPHTALPASLILVGC